MNWSAKQKQQAHDIAVEVWTFLSATGSNCTRVVRLRKGRRGAAGPVFQIQLASLRAIGEAARRRAGDALAKVKMPYWPHGLMKSRASYNLGEDAEDIGRLDVLGYFGPDTQGLLTKPALSPPPGSEWPAAPPRATVNVERLEDWLVIAAKLAGLLTPIPSEQILPGASRVTPPIFYVAHASAHLRPLAGDAIALAPSPARVSISPGPPEIHPWSGDDQAGAFSMCRLPAPWLGNAASRAPAPGRVLGAAAKEVWHAMTALPMGWVYSAPIFQSIHRRVALLEEPGGAGMQTHMRQSYEKNGIPISRNRANQRQVLVTRTGVEVGGVAGRAANIRTNNAQLHVLTMRPLVRDRSLGNQLLIIVGRWVRPLEFRRPLLGVFNAIWEQIGTGKSPETALASWRVATCCCPSHPPTSGRWRWASRRALMRARTALACARPWEWLKGASDFLANLGDPETRGHRVAGYSGRRVVELPRDLKPGTAKDEPRILLVSLFDGIGGAAASPVRAGFVVGGHLGSEVDEGARRVLGSRWPGLIEFGHVGEIRDEQLE
ncbi:unnamed protein product, partial [Prorocentrum cordatum]